jgi:uncharacterized repeat protein (TIGR01451 family)
VKNYFTLLLLSFTLFPSCILLAQPATQWLNYTDDFLINDITELDNKLWIATHGGVVCFDKQTKTHVLYNKGNSNLMNNNVYKIVADSAGRIWASSGNSSYPSGITMFDGNEWTSFYVIPGTNDTIGTPVDLEVDKYGNLYFVNFYWDIVKVDSNLNFTYLPSYPIDTSQAVNNPHHIAIDTNGNLWLTAHKLFLFDGIQWIDFDSTNTNLPAGYPSDVFTDRTNGIYVIFNTSNDGYQIYSRDTTAIWSHIIPPPQSNWARYATEIYIDYSNNLWFYWITNGNCDVIKFDGTNWTNYIYPSSGFPDDISPAVFYVDQNNYLYGAFYPTQDTVFFEFDGQSWKGYDLGNGALQTNHGICVEIDHHGKKWFGFYGGIASFDGYNWNWYDQYNSGLQTDNIKDLGIDNANNVWACTGENLNAPPLFKFDGANWNAVTAFPDYDEMLLCCHRDLSGKLWFGGRKGIYSFDGMNWLTHPLTPSDEVVFDVNHDFQNNVWVSTSYNGIFKYDGSTFTNYTSQNSGLMNDNCSLLALDSTGVIHASNNAGSFMFDGTDFIPFSPCAAVVPQPYVVYIIGAGPDCLWYQGLYHPLIKYDSSGCQNINGYNSQIAGTPFDLAYDSYGNIWMASQSGGIQVFNPGEIDPGSIFYPASLPASGEIFFDFNSNGEKDSISDFGLNNQKLIILPDSIYTFSQSSGKYVAFLDTALYEIVYEMDTMWQLTSDSASYHFLIKDNPITGLDFGVTSTNVISSLNIDLTSGIFRCNTNSPAWLKVQNNGNIPLSGLLEYIPDDSLTNILYYPAPDFINGDTVSWLYNGLNPGAQLLIFANYHTPGIQPQGDTLISYLNNYIGNIKTDSIILKQTVICSWDPNDKLAEPPGLGLQHYIENETELTYTIRFENTGNDTAFYVQIIDTLDEDLNPGTFEFVSSSHPVEIQINPDRTAFFRFRNINLLWTALDPAASQGYIKFRITPKSGLSNYTVISNSAAIFFDYNFPVVTNTVFHTIMDPLPTGFSNVTDQKIVVFPNPASTSIKIKFSNHSTPEKIEIINQQGILLKSFERIDQLHEIDISFLKNGIYFLKSIDTTRGITALKLVVAR